MSWTGREQTHRSAASRCGHIGRVGHGRCARPCIRDDRMTGESCEAASQRTEGKSAISEIGRMALWSHIVDSTAPRHWWNYRVKPCSKSSIRYDMGKCVWSDNRKANQEDNEENESHAYALKGIIRSPSPNRTCTFVQA